MEHKKFIGTGVAIVTPFTQEKSIDFPALEKVIEHLISNNIDYLVVLGTTGESVTLCKEEKRDILSFVTEKVNKRVPVVAGFGCNNTSDLVKQIEGQDFTNIDAVLSVSPYYNKPTQEGLYQHYKTIAAASPAPVFLYNVPGRTGSNIQPETTLRLAGIDNIIAVKEASGSIAQISSIIKDKPDDFLVISGDDAMTIPLIAMGGSGVISVAANAIPNEFTQMVQAALKNDFKKATSIHYKIMDLMAALFAEGNPGGIKAALNLLGITENTLRLPLVPVSDKTYKLIDKLMKELKKT